MGKIINDFKANDYINKVFNKGSECIEFDYYNDEDYLTHVYMNLIWTEEDKNIFIDKFNNFYNELININGIDVDKAEAIFNQYFKDYDKNKYFEDLSVLGSRANHLIAFGSPNIIYNKEFETYINLILLNHFATKAHIIREVSEYIEFDNKTS